MGSLAFFCFLLAEFGSINRHQFTGYSGSKISVEIPPSDGSNDTFGSSMVWLFHMLLGLEHFTSPTAQSDGNVVSGSYWVPTPSGNPLTMIIPGILIGSVRKSFHYKFSDYYSVLCISCSKISSKFASYLIKLSYFFSVKSSTWFKCSSSCLGNNVHFLF